MLYSKQHLKSCPLVVGGENRVVFDECTFDNVVCGTFRNELVFPRIQVARLELRRSMMFNCGIGPIMLSDTLASDLRTGDIEIFWGTIFERTILEGKVGRVKLNKVIDSLPDPALQASYDADRQQHYEKVDWALDLTNARPSMLELEGIPASKLVLDGDSQCVLSRSRAREAGLRAAALCNPPRGLVIAIEDLLESEEDECVIIAPTGQKKARYQPYLDCIRELRSMGVLLPTGAR